MLKDYQPESRGRSKYRSHQLSSSSSKEASHPTSSSTRPQNSVSSLEMQPAWMQSQPWHQPPCETQWWSSALPFSPPQQHPHGVHFLAQPLPIQQFSFLSEPHTIQTDRHPVHHLPFLLPRARVLHWTANAGGGLAVRRGRENGWWGSWRGKDSGGLSARPAWALLPCLVLPGYGKTLAANAATERVFLPSRHRTLNPNKVFLGPPPPWCCGPTYTCDLSFVHIEWVHFFSFLLLKCKVDVPNSVTFLNWSPTFKWYVVFWCGSKNE